MKKALVLLCSVMLAGCFVCQKGRSQKKAEEVAPQPAPLAAAQPAEPVKQAEPAKPAQPVKPVQPAFTRHPITEAANFEFDSRKIRPDSNKMDEVKKLIAANPDAVIVIVGHTDNIGPKAYNDRLSVERAKAVAAELAKQGYPNEVRIEGMGSSSPIASNDTEEGRARNRRVDVVLVRE